MVEDVDVLDGESLGKALSVTVKRSKKPRWPRSSPHGGSQAAMKPTSACHSTAVVSFGEMSRSNYVRELHASRRATHAYADLGRVAKVDTDGACEPRRRESLLGAQVDQRGDARRTIVGPECGAEDLDLADGPEHDVAGFVDAGAVKVLDVGLDAGTLSHVTRGRRATARRSPAHA